MITNKITDMTSKLQMLITFAPVVRLRLTIYQNAQNFDNGPRCGCDAMCGVHVNIDNGPRCVPKLNFDHNHA